MHNPFRKPRKCYHHSHIPIITHTPRLYNQMIDSLLTLIVEHNNKQKKNTILPVILQHFLRLPRDITTNFPYPSFKRRNLQNIPITYRHFC